MSDGLASAFVMISLHFVVLSAEVKSFRQCEVHIVADGGGAGNLEPKAKRVELTTQGRGRSTLGCGQLAHRSRLQIRVCYAQCVSDMVQSLWKTLMEFLEAHCCPTVLHQVRAHHGLHHH